MGTFTPVNNLEIKLRALLRDKNTPYWSFYTPLAAAPLWIIVRHHPELDGSDLVAPEGQNPAVCIFRLPEYSYIGVYTAESRVQAIFERWNISTTEMTYVSAPGYQLLRLLMTYEKVDYLWINGGLMDCQLRLDPDMVEILLSRPEPEYEERPSHHIALHPDEDPQRFLQPLREFLGQQPTVRAAWIFGDRSAPSLPADHYSYEIGLLMQDPEDESLLAKVVTMAKALTPVEMNWTSSLLMADNRALRSLAEDQAPFYQAADFLKSEKSR